MALERGAQPGNINAQRRGEFIRTLERAIAQDNGKRLRECAEKLLDLAAMGEAWAVRELADRLDGKAAQAIALQDPGGAPLFSTVERVIIDQVRLQAAQAEVPPPDDRVLQ
jgi:hypothetical protein